MTENKNFNKTKPISTEQLKEILNTDYGIKLKMSDIPVGTHVIMKILDVPKKVENTLQDGTKFTTNIIRCEFDNTPNGGKKFQLDVQLGDNCMERLVTKYSEGEYVDKRAFFTRTNYKGKFPQFINPIMKEGNFQQVNKDDLFAPKVDNEVEKPKEETNPKDDLLFSSDDIEEKIMDFKVKPEEEKLLEQIRGLDQSVITEEKFISTVMGRLNIPKSRAEELFKYYNETKSD